METKQKHRRSDLIRCNICGEEYSPIYRRCPFCEEAERSVSGGKRLRNNRGGGYSTGFTVFRVLGIAVPLVVILIAIYVVFSIVRPMIHPASPASDSSSSFVSESSSAGEDIVHSITLNTSEVTLPAIGASYTLTVTIDPADAAATVEWISSDSTVVVVNDAGIITALNSGTATISATAGGATAQCVVTCDFSEEGSGADTPSEDTPSTNTSSTNTAGNTGAIAAGSDAVINTEGVNIRSGPGSGYSVQDSGTRGAEVTILDNSVEGWYQISYRVAGGTATGYIASQYVTEK